MCCPLFSPQMTGGAGPSGGITVNSRIIIRVKKRGLSPYQGVAQTLAHDGVRVLHHGVHGVGEVVLERPRQAERLEVEPELADAWLCGADLEVAGALAGDVEGEVGGVLVGLVTTTLISSQRNKKQIEETTYTG